MKFSYFQASKNPLIQCLLCECSTLEESLRAHIQYNHMIYKDQILKVGNSNDKISFFLNLFVFQVLYDLHYPPVNKAMLNNMLDTCEVRENI